MKKGKKIIGIIIIILFTYIYAHVAKPYMIYDKTVDTSDYISLGIQKSLVEQEFVCELQSLDAISVKCQLHGEEESIKVRLTLWDMENNVPAAVAEADGTELKNGKQNVFSFERIENCKGRRYKVVLENIGSGIETGEGAGFVCQPETEENTRLAVGGALREGTLIIKTVTKGFDAETFVVLFILIIYIIGFFRFLERLFSR